MDIYVLRVLANTLCGVSAALFEHRKPFTSITIKCKKLLATAESIYNVFFSHFHVHTLVQFRTYS